MRASDVAFSESVKAVQVERGSRAVYARGDFHTHVTDELVELLAGLDTAFLATVNAAGQPYIQHRGGPKGFLRALDARTLGFVDFAGNRQYVSTGNLRDDERVCLFLIDYARRRRIKVWGCAKMVPLTDALRAALVPEGYRARPEQVCLVTVEAWDMNCPQHIPQKLDAADVMEVVGSLKARVAELEAELDELRRR